jgi:hypothetical protein
MVGRVTFFGNSHGCRVGSLAMPAALAQKTVVPVAPAAPAS